MMLRVFVFILAMVCFWGIFVNWHWRKIFVAGESQKHPEELLSNETKVLLVLLQARGPFKQQARQSQPRSEPAKPPPKGKTSVAKALGSKMQTVPNKK